MKGKLFGTTGVRKVYGTEFDISMALDLGRAFGTYIEQGRVLLARDARTTSEMIEDAFAAGVMSTGVSVIRAGVIPTPTLAFMTKHGGYDAGVMVTASHNPPEYTGIKFWSKTSMGFVPEEEREIERIYTSHEFRVAPWDGLGSDSVLDNAVREHIRALLDRTRTDKIAARKFTVVVDPGNGAACVLAPYLIRELGCKVVSINSQIDGHFPGRKSEPDEESLGDLIRMVKEIGADLGVAHDGDSDRVVFVTEAGEVIRGDRTIALLARGFLKQQPGATIVTTVDSSKVLDEIVEADGGRVIRTPVGDIQVAIEIEKKGGVFGGEACGVFIFPEFHLAPEPFLATCKLLELMAETGRSFGGLISDVPIYPLLKTKVSCENEKKSDVMRDLAEKVPQGFDDVVETITVDGVGVSLKSGWVLVRPSGTEPVIRITCEAKDPEEVRTILERAKEIVSATIATR